MHQQSLQDVVVEEDAMACAAIVLRGCSEVGVADLTQLAEYFMIRRGRLYSAPVHPRGQAKAGRGKQDEAGARL